MTLRIWVSRWSYYASRTMVVEVQPLGQWHQHHLYPELVRNTDFWSHLDLQSQKPGQGRGERGSNLSHKPSRWF